MKNIQAISIWDNGHTKNGVILNAYAIRVTLGQSAVFYYSILSEDLQTLAQGSITMSGTAYQNWNEDDIAWEFIAEQLNLVITGQYVGPTTTSTTTII